MQRMRVENFMCLQMIQDNVVYEPASNIDHGGKHGQAISNKINACADKQQQQGLYFRFGVRLNYVLLGSQY